MRFHAVSAGQRRQQPYRGSEDKLPQRNVLFHCLPVPENRFHQSDPLPG